MKKYFFLIILLISFLAKGQTDSLLTASQKPRTGRKAVIGIASAAAMAGSLYVFTTSSGNKYHNKFSVINDNDAWLQVDKAEHAYIAYTSTRFLFQGWKWAGLSDKNALIISSASSLAYLSLKEYTDGRMVNWGWSWGDMGANLTGTALFALQQIAWNQQKVQFKVSSFPATIEPKLQRRSDDLFGASLPSQLIKNHNLQTYWLSVNVKSVTGFTGFPSWINIALGYGGANMYGTFENVEFRNGVKTFDAQHLKRNRQFYLAPDIDLTKIKTKSRVLKTLFFVLNSVKVPLPAIEFSDNKFKAHLIHF